MLLLNIIDLIRTHILSLIHACDLYNNILFFTKPRHIQSCTDIVSLIQPCCHTQGNILTHEVMYASLTYTPSAMLKIHSVTVTPGGKISSNRFITENVSLHCIYSNDLPKVIPSLRSDCPSAVPSITARWQCIRLILLQSAP